MKKNVVITGANGGVGRALVEEMANKGCNVWACVRKKTEEFETFIGDIENKNSVWIKIVILDLENDSSIKEAYKEISGCKENIDVLINNAGVGHMALFQMTTIEEIRRIYDVNIISIMRLTQFILRNMIKQKSGKIINISSTAAEEIYEGNAVYGATKAALNIYTQALAAEVFKYGINVNAISPGLIDTNMSMIFEGKNPEKPISHTALERKITPQEIADVVSWVIGEKTNIINGEIIHVTGGHK